MSKNRIEELRKSMKLSQSALAKKIGVTRQAISAYETDKRIPKPDIMDKLANTFNVSVPYILGYTNDREGINSDKEILAIFNKIKDRKINFYDESSANNFFKIEKNVNYLLNAKKELVKKENNNLKELLNTLYALAVEDPNSFSTGNSESPIFTLMKLVKHTYFSDNKKLITSFTTFVSDMSVYLSDNPLNSYSCSKKDVLKSFSNFLDEYKK